MAEDEFTREKRRRQGNVIPLGKKDPSPDKTVDTEAGHGMAPEPGMIDVTITHLEMDRFPTRQLKAPGVKQISLMRARNPTISFYRFLYDTVGEPWCWHERRRPHMDDEALASIIHDPRVAVYVLYVGGIPAGFVELDSRPEPDIEIAYFGLMPEFIGQRLGPYFLDWAIAKAATSEPERLILNTCTLDHPKAISVYQRAGFKPYAQETRRIKDPRSESPSDG